MAEIVIDPRQHGSGMELPEATAEDLARPGPLSSDQIREFYENGVVIVRGLLHGDLLRRAMEVRRETKTMMASELYGSVTTESWRQHDVFRELALTSPLAEAAEQLTPPRERGADEEARKKPLRVLRDAFFSMEPGKTGCGWHVDDSYFWPTSRDGPAGPGLNVWVALDEVKEGRGGGLAYAPGSHRAGFLPHRAVIKQGAAQQTCEMKTLSPESHASLDAIKVCPALQPGDAIILTRFLFHRGDPFVDHEGEPVARYSVRYVPDTAVLEGVNMVMKDGQKSFVHFAGEKISNAGEDLGYFPATNIGNITGATGGA